MPNLLTQTITAAAANQLSKVFQFREGVPRNLCVQFNFTYGSGGTSLDGYLQTTLDGGGTWSDIAQFHVTTSSERRFFNLSSLTPVTTQGTPTDGSLASNAAVDGLMGTQLRVKYTSVGTYAGGTTLAVDIASIRAFSP